MLRMKQVLLMAALLVCLTALPVLAQDTASATPADTSGPTGITTLVILAGLGAMFAVGGMIYMRENNKNGKEVD